MQSVIEPNVSDAVEDDSSPAVYSNGKKRKSSSNSISAELSELAHKNLKNLRTDIVPGHRFTIPDILIGILENITVDQVQAMMKKTIEERVGLAERKARLDKLIAETPLDELEKLLASRKS